MILDDEHGTLAPDARDRLRFKARPAAWAWGVLCRFRSEAAPSLMEVSSAE